MLTPVVLLTVARAERITKAYRDGEISRDEAKQDLIRAFQLEASDAELLMKELDDAVDT